MLNNVKKHLFGLLFALLIVGFLLLACGGATEQPLAPGLPVRPLRVVTAPLAADLLMGETHVEAYNDTYLTYQIVATIVNAGAGDASGFNAGCTYQCPAGDPTLSGGLDIVQGGSIAGNSRFAYESPFHYMCESRPPTLNLMCSISSAQGGTQTYSVNVKLP
jgi:hypothetical protein